MAFIPSHKKKHKTDPGEARLQLTSMMDMFTIILVFLLKTYSTHGQLINPSEDLTLPSSMTQQMPELGLDVTVSSLGDATSLQGGTLLITPLHGVDDEVYAVAQGNITVGIESSTPVVPYVRQRQATVGRIPSGALVEKEVPVSIGDKGLLTIVLDDPDFTTADRVAASIRGIGLDAAARDAGTVTVSVGGENIVALVSRVENLTVVPDVVAKIVINERTGTVVIGENVKIAPVAVSYAGIDVTIGDISLFSEGAGADAVDEEARYRAHSQARLERTEGRLRVVPAGATLSSLVSALNTIGASPKDLIAILQAMKKAGAIKSELEVI